MNEQPGRADTPPRDDDRPTLARLRRGDAVVWIAAVALLFTMALDWYTDVQGEDARRTESIYEPDDVGLGADRQSEIQEDARIAAEEREQNAWQADGLIDRLVLLGLLATVALGIGAGVLRALGRRYEPPWTPTALAGAAGAATALLLIYRLAVNQPGLDAAAQVKAGGALALVVLAVLILGAADSLRAERREDASPDAPRRERASAPWLEQQPPSP